jgi:hypothetical protein
MDGGSQSTLSRFRAARWQQPLGPFACFGQCWSVRTTSPRLADYIGSLYRSMISTDALDGRGRCYSVLPPGHGTTGAVYRDDELLLERSSHTGTLDALISAVNRQVVEDSDHTLILHAAAADRDGRALLLPAPAGSGKTTLVAGLLDRGFAYLSDEAVAIDGNRIVEAYPKPLTIRKGSWDVLRHLEPGGSAGLSPYFEQQWHVPPQDLAPVVLRSTIAVMVFAKYDVTARTRVKQLSPADAVGLLVPCTFASDADRLSPEQLGGLARTSTAIPAYSLRWSDLQDACDVVISLLELGDPAAGESTESSTSDASSDAQTWN